LQGAEVNGEFNQCQAPQLFSQALSPHQNQLVSRSQGKRKLQGLVPNQEGSRELLLPHKDWKYLMVKVIIIDAEKKEVRLADISSELSELQRIVKGYIELALRWPNKDILYVDEEGLCKDYQYGFHINGRQFVGNGVVTGLKGSAQVDVVSTLEEIRDSVKFLSKVEPQNN
jgi:hypothetical protein